MFWNIKKNSIFATLLEKGITIRIQIRAFSSAGSEHLPYKQRVGGSNPSTPTSNFISNKKTQNFYFKGV